MNIIYYLIGQYLSLLTGLIIFIIIIVKDSKSKKKQVEETKPNIEEYEKITAEQEEQFMNLYKNNREKRDV